MGSYDFGKKEVKDWILKTIPTTGAILDVGACDGKWRNNLTEYENVDAVEIFQPNIERIQGMYREVFNADIVGLEYGEYDLIIFGDIIEHLTVEDAQKVLEYAKTKAKHILVSVPYQYRQDAIDGNPHEVHKQWDLTPELFNERYPGFTVLIQPANNYCHYICEGSCKATRKGSTKAKSGNAVKRSTSSRRKGSANGAKKEAS